MRSISRSLRVRRAPMKALRDLWRGRWDAIVLTLLAVLWIVQWIWR